MVIPSNGWFQPTLKNMKVRLDHHPNFQNIGEHKIHVPKYWMVNGWLSHGHPKIAKRRLQAGSAVWSSGRPWRPDMGTTKMVKTTKNTGDLGNIWKYMKINNMNMM